LALEAADRLHDRLAVGPGLLHLAHVVPRGGLEDRRLGAGEVLRGAVIVGALDDGLVEAAVGRLHVLAEVLAYRAGDAVAPADGVDDERRTLDAVTAGEQLVDPGVAAAIGGDESTRPQRCRITGALHDLAG